jgi:hypothetical protein
MTVGSTQPVTDKSIRNIPGVESRLAREAENLAAICEELV